MSDDENNLNHELGSNPGSDQGIEQNDNRQQTPTPEDEQNPENTDIQGERFEPNDENVPEEVKEETEKLGKGKLDAFYKISEEEYEKIKKHVPEDLRKTIVNSKIENGKPPQLWLPVINNLAFGLIAFVPGLNIAYAAVLYANLKILPMWPKKKMGGLTTYNTIENKANPPKPDSKNDGKSHFGNNPPNTPKLDDENNEKQNFGIKDDDNDNKKQSFGSKEEDNKSQTFGSKGTSDPSNAFLGSKSVKNTGMNFGAADANSTIKSLTKVQSFGNAPSSTTHVDSLKSSTKKKSSFGIGNPS